jgi:hypothetical protein
MEHFWSVREHQSLLPWTFDLCEQGSENPRQVQTRCYRQMKIVERFELSHRMAKLSPPQSYFSQRPTDDRRNESPPCAG